MERGSSAEPSPRNPCLQQVAADTARLQGASGKAAASTSTASTQYPKACAATPSTHDDRAAATAQAGTGPEGGAGEELEAGIGTAAGGMGQGPRSAGPKRKLTLQQENTAVWVGAWPVRPTRARVPVHACVPACLLCVCALWPCVHYWRLGKHLGRQGVTQYATALMLHCLRLGKGLGRQGVAQHTNALKRLPCAPAWPMRRLLQKLQLACGAT